MLTPDEAFPEDRPVFGVNPDWGVETLSEFADATGVRPGSAATFVDIPFTDADVQNVTAAAEQVADMGGVLMLTVEPTGGLDAVTDEAVNELVALLQGINDAGVPVLLRYAHEMNGSWYAWGQQPEAYVKSFRRVAHALRDTPAAQMLWTPNYAGGYPFSTGQYAAQPGTSEYQSLDTTGDGRLTEDDDPYAPYYPGDDVVDWVGMTLYHWGNEYPWGANDLPEEGKFVEQLTGNYAGIKGDETTYPDFYATYAQSRGKPMAIPGTAAFVNTEASPGRSLEIKRAWWRQVFASDVREEFPQLRLINWFNWDKHESEVDAVVRWSVTSDDNTAREFGEDLPEWLGTGESVTTSE